MSEEGDAQMTDSQLLPPPPPPPPPCDEQQQQYQEKDSGEEEGREKVNIKLEGENDKEIREKDEDPLKSIPRQGNEFEVDPVKEEDDNNQDEEKNPVIFDVQIPQLEKQHGEDNLNVKPQQQQPVEQDIQAPPPGWDSLPPPPLLEMGQMICGSCRHLLSYPQGSKHVRCSCCLTVNYVLEEHQVGQVKCGNCAVLLMYPFGAQSVGCCSCCSVIDIGDHNRRPPLSVQQSRACRPFSIGH